MLLDGNIIPSIQEMGKVMKRHTSYPIRNIDLTIPFTES